MTKEFSATFKDIICMANVDVMLSNIPDVITDNTDNSERLKEIEEYLEENGEDEALRYFKRNYEG
jgi:hypothetical protein